MHLQFQQEQKLRSTCQLDEVANGAKVTEAVQSKERYVILQPIAMTVPNRHHIYAPNKLVPPKRISYPEFLDQYADYPREIRVCLAETSSPEEMLKFSSWMTAYSFGLDCWYIAIL